MNYSDLAAAAEKLAQNPPRFAVTPQRKEILLEVDRLFGEANSERSAELGQFYRDRVDAAIKEIIACRGETPRLWKLYSSGVIIKDADRTIGVDIANCVPIHGRSTVVLHQQQITALADILDEYYVTHAHADHIDPLLCDALAERKKLIVMPQEALELWMVPSAHPAENFTSDHVKTFLSWQGKDEIPGRPCSMYLFTVSNGKRIFIRGDIFHRDGFNGCMAQIRQWGEKVDYFFSSPYYTSGDAPIPQLATEFDCRFIPIHEWEFIHRTPGKSGPATQWFEELHETLAEPYARGKAQFLLWGESIALD